MKEDYLWDKKGNDPEIIRLENALRGFRYKESAPPALPLKQLPFEEKTPRKLFRLAFALAVCLSFIFVFLGIWMQMSLRIVEDREIAVQTPPPKKQIFDFPNHPAESELPDALPVEKIGRSAPHITKPVMKKRKSVVAVKTSVKNYKAKNTTIMLTKEEKEAYEKLMLALSITSAKLKLVRDKVQGIDEQNAVLEKRK